MKTKTFLCFVAGLSTFCVACQDNETASECKGEKPSVSVTAKIGYPKVESRYAQLNESSVASFCAKDAIGIFMDNDAAVRWTYDGNNWTTANAMFWSDRTSEHTFYAYYPCPSIDGVSKERIPMPDLSKQQGKWSELHTYDFLVAQAKTSYESNSGNVSFSGEQNCFKHASTLMKISVLVDNSLQDAVVNQLSLSGKGLFSPASYSFASGKVAVDGELSQYSAVTSNENQSADIAYYFVVNEKHAALNSKDNEIDLSLKYTLNDHKQYTAHGKISASELLAGHFYKYKLKVDRNGLTVYGCEITDWVPGNTGEEIITLH